MATVGGAAWAAIGVLVLLVAALSIVVGATPSNEPAYLQSLAGHATAATLTFALFAAADVLLVPALVALYPALARAGKAATLVGTGLLAVIASIEGLVGGFYVIVPALSTLLLPSLVTFGLWALLAGTNLLRRTPPTRQRRATAAPTT